MLRLQGKRRKRTLTEELDCTAIRREFAEQINLEFRMRKDPTGVAALLRPWHDMRPHLFQPIFAIGYGIGAEAAARHSICTIDPTANQSLVEFILRVPDEQFRRDGCSASLFQRAFYGRLPEAVLKRQMHGLQSADLGHRILKEFAAIQESLASMEAEPEASEMLNLPLMRRCLDDLKVRVDPESTARAASILLRGLAVGLFLRRVRSTTLNESHGQ
jgi:hypothetical protein